MSQTSARIFLVGLLSLLAAVDLLKDCNTTRRGLVKVGPSVPDLNAYLYEDDEGRGKPRGLTFGEPVLVDDLEEEEEARYPSLFESFPADAAAPAE